LTIIAHAFCLFLTPAKTCNPVAQNAASVTQVTFSPHDNTLMAVSGKNMLKQVKFHEGQLKQQAFHKVQPQERFEKKTWKIRCLLEKRIFSLNMILEHVLGVH
jgi:hypothetical protein